MEGVWRKSLMVLILAVFAGQLVFGQDDYGAELDKLKSHFPDVAIPNVTLPFEQILTSLKDKCEKEAGNEAAFEEAQQAAGKVQECLTPLLDWTELVKEVEEAKPTGDLELVFNKYCRRRYTAMDCIRNFTKSASPCLSEAELEHKVMFENMLDKLFSFVCHKDGDQIALFIAEKGPECFTAKKDAMWRCVNETYGEQLALLAGMQENLDEEKLKDLAKKEIPQFTIEKSDCEKLEEVEACISDVLEQCDETTPANLFQSAAKFVRNESPCKNFTSRYSQSKGRDGNGAGALMALPWLVGAAVVAMFVKLGV